jgi:hypothetical protein
VNIRVLPLILAGVALLSEGRVKAGDAKPFSFFENRGGPEVSLTVQAPAIRGATVTVLGGDSRRPSTPFTFDWGDGSRSEAFFPATHTYADTGRNYTVTTTAHYPTGESRASVTASFVRPTFAFKRDAAIPHRVTVASAPIRLESTMPGYEPPAGLLGFAGADLSLPRELIEYVLDIGHALQMDFCNRDVDTRGGLGQVVLSQPGFGGACSLWFTKPVCTAANPTYLSDPSGISSLFHEMGHNITLNSPARYRFGGKTDGPMSTIVSETLAQIMQHATAYELLNRRGQYGLPADVTQAIRRSAQDAFGVTSRAYREYVAKGCPYATIQSGEPGEPDRTFGTFMAVAYEFVRLADERHDFRKPLQRTMALLQTFNERDHRRFQERGSEAFRGTLMVAAFSYGFNTDVRPTFRRLSFLVDDSVYRELIGRMPGRVNFVL